MKNEYIEWYYEDFGERVAKTLTRKSQQCEYLSRGGTKLYSQITKGWQGDKKVTKKKFCHPKQEEENVHTEATKLYSPWGESNSFDRAQSRGQEDFNRGEGLLAWFSPILSEARLTPVSQTEPELSTIFPVR